VAQETVKALDPKPTSAELANMLALLNYLGAETVTATLAYLCEQG